MLCSFTWVARIVRLARVSELSRFARLSMFSALVILNTFSSDSIVLIIRYYLSVSKDYLFNNQTYFVKYSIVVLLI